MQIFVATFWPFLYKFSPSELHSDHNELGYSAYFSTGIFFVSRSLWTTVRLRYLLLLYRKRFNGPGQLLHTTVQHSLMTRSKWERRLSPSTTARSFRQRIDEQHHHGAPTRYQEDYGRGVQGLQVGTSYRTQQNGYVSHLLIQGK